jgi:hypothetical protein
MTKPSNIPAGWKQFKLATGELKWLPPWANESLCFERNPDKALRQGAWKKVIGAKRKGK